jgi:hypothetical protein
MGTLRSFMNERSREARGLDRILTRVSSGPLTNYDFTEIYSGHPPNSRTRSSFYSYRIHDLFSRDMWNATNAVSHAGTCSNYLLTHYLHFILITSTL